MYYENFEDKSVGYAAYAANVYDGTVKGYDEAEEKVRELTKAIDETRDLLEDKSYGTASRAKFVEKINKLMDERDALQNAMKDLTGAEIFDQSIDNTTNLAAPEAGLSLANETGGHIKIEKNRKREVGFIPDTVVIAQNIPEGGTPDPIEVKDKLVTIQTDGADRFSFQQILNMPETMRNDDKAVFDTSTMVLHRDAITNGENAKAMELLEAAQSPVDLSLTSPFITGAINRYLSGNHKKNAVIITNRGGFATLDNTVNGVSLVKRGADGNFWYLEKYKILEMDDTVLPYIGDDAPVFIGDFSQALRFYLIRDSVLQKDTIERDTMRFLVQDRMVREEIIKVMTGSRAVWFWGLLHFAKCRTEIHQDDTGEESAPGDENQPSEDQPPVIDDPIDDPQPPEGTTDNEDSVEAVALCTEDQPIEDSQPSENQIDEGIQPTEDTEEIPGDSDTAETA